MKPYRSKLFKEYKFKYNQQDFKQSKHISMYLSVNKKNEKSTLYRSYVLCMHLVQTY